ncbi:hypothetical protein HBIAX_05371 [Achromobacter xylosoxidans]|uniref:Hydrogenase transcriptional regulatory protein hupR1 n=1 Tax=Achromobacter veterisilvae TaxID=2069367 RepID=A0A446CSU4_9BURK|nr:hypothetical protein HBIAX_05371 [Achromobacter xylosoxidans]SSW70912.1 Hydrogenase transcriptional regulatory protein hupR1 [Achromobacter veterisilvae]
MNARLRVPTVLVVDDEVRSQDAMRRTLEEDFTVLTASGADEARGLLQRQLMSVILCDQRMLQFPAEAVGQTGHPRARQTPSPADPPPRTELVRMHRNFYGFDPSYHVARYHFLHKWLHSWTRCHLAVHR